ncbi:MAG: hypothetical protein JKY19_14145 [Alcanivoracaceae bacterium]|nr:hypothetical protein [Alcanivoracaceae bacterium]
MLRLIIPLLFSSIICAQENLNISDKFESKDKVFPIKSGVHKYIALQDSKVYDVEIIIFAYRNSLPNNKTYRNKSLFADSDALTLQLKPRYLPYIQPVDSENNENNENAEYIQNPDLTINNNNPDIKTTNTTEYTISIEDDEEDIHVLSWFEHKPESYKLTPIWKRLLQQQNIVPLLHKAWRQTETPFDNPTYVKISNIISHETNDEQSINTAPGILINTLDSTEYDIDASNSNNIPQNIEDSNDQSVLYSDFTINGKVALSQGRFMHFGHNLNLFRLYHNEENKLQNMYFSLIERRQIKPDELHYFDSPWLGSIVKITEYIGEEKNEETTE